jgi:hypothetical protein
MPNRKFVMTVAPPTPSTEQPRIPIEQWGKDHWSTFAYLETRCVDHGGVVDIRHMRCDSHRHPQFAHIRTDSDKKYPTQYKGGLLQDHDDWDCLDDCELLGLIENKGTGLHRVYKLTALGRMIAAQIRQHKQDKGNFGDFTPRI